MRLFKLTSIKAQIDTIRFVSPESKCILIIIIRRGIIIFNKKCWIHSRRNSERCLLLLVRLQRRGAAKNSVSIISGESERIGSLSTSPSTIWMLTPISRGSIHRWYFWRNYQEYEAHRLEKYGASVLKPIKYSIIVST